MIRKKNIISIVVLLLCLPAMGFAQGLPAQTYRVKSGDTLSSIAMNKVSGKPIYGKTGSLNILTGLNPEILNPNRIKPGTLIRLPSLQEAQEEKVSQRSVATVVEPTQNKCEPQLSVQSTNQETLPVAKSKFRTWLGFSYDRFDSTDKATKVQSTMLSSLDPSIGAAWDMSFGSAWGIGLEGQLVSQEIQKNITSSRSIQDSHHYLGAMAFSVFHSDTDADSRLSIGTAEGVFPRTLANSDIILDKVVIPFVKLERTWKWHVVRDGDIGLGGSVSYLLPSQGVGYDVDAGFGAAAHFQWTHTVQDRSLGGRLFYSLEKQDSSYVEQQKSSIGLQLIYSGPLL